MTGKFPELTPSEILNFLEILGEACPLRRERVALKGHSSQSAMGCSKCFKKLETKTLEPQNLPESAFPDPVRPLKFFHENTEYGEQELSCVAPITLRSL